MSSKRGAGVLSRLFANILRTRLIRNHEKTAPVTLVGTDRRGNKYFVRPGNPALSVKESRWIVGPTGDQSEIPNTPAQWESWLRGRRADPPTEEEIAGNQAIMDSRVRRAGDKNDELRRISEPEKDVQGREEVVPFPKREGLDSSPGGVLKGKD